MTTIAGIYGSVEFTWPVTCSHLLLIMAATTLYVIAQGIDVVEAGQRCGVDIDFAATAFPHWV